MGRSRPRRTATGGRGLARHRHVPPPALSRDTHRERRDRRAADRGRPPGTSATGRVAARGVSTPGRLAAVALLVAVAAWTGSAAETPAENPGVPARYPRRQGAAPESGRAVAR